MNHVPLSSLLRLWCAAFSLVLLATAATATPPVATTTAAGRPSGTVLARPHNGSAVITITYEAQDADGNLTGIRPQVWHQATDYFQNNNGQWIPTDGTKATYELQVPLDRDGDWFFWTDAIDADGNFVNSLCWADAYKIVIEESPSTPPTVTMEILGLGYSQEIVRPKGGAATVMARFRAVDDDGNLTGIRPQMYHPASNYFWNNGGVFTPQSGMWGELAIPVDLPRSGEWLIWADAIDAEGNFANSGAWGDAFVVRVAESNEPNDDAVAVDVNGDHIPDEVIKCGTGMFTMTFGSYYNDCDDYWWYDPTSDFFLFDSSFWTGDYRWSFNDIWLPSVYFWSSCDLYVEPLLVYEAEAGYDYAIYRDVSGTVGVNPADWVLESSGAPGGGTQYHSLGFYGADMVNYGQFYLVRYGQPIAGAMFTAANGFPIGRAAAGTGPGTPITIPSVGRVILKAINALGKLVLNPSQAIWEITQGQNIIRTAYGQELDITSLVAGVYVIKLRLDDNTTIPIPIIVNRSDGMTRMWETTNPVNRVLNNAAPPFKDDPYEIGGVKYNWLPANHLYVVAKNEAPFDRYEVSIAASLEGNPTEYLAAPYLLERSGAGVKKSFGGVDARFGANSVCNLTIHDGPQSSENPRSTKYILKIGRDGNSNNVLDDNEAEELSIRKENGDVIGPATVVGVSEESFESLEGKLWRISALGYWDWWNPIKKYPDAPKFVRIFYAGSSSDVPAAYQPTDQREVDFNCFGGPQESGTFAEWLSHHAGADFNETGAAKIMEYIWEGTDQSGARHPLWTLVKAPETRKACRAYFENHVRAQMSGPGWYPADSSFKSVIGEYPNLNPDLNVPGVIVPGVPGTTVEYKKEDDANANATFGRLRLLTHEARFYAEEGENGLVLKKVTSKIVAIDLYDFNFENPDPAPFAAAVQIGYRKNQEGRGHGKIYRTKFDLELTDGGY